MGAGVAGREGHRRELVVGEGLSVVLQRADEIVAVELPRVHAHGVQRESVVGEAHGRAAQLAVSATRRARR